MGKRRKVKAFSFGDFDASHYKTTEAYVRAVGKLYLSATDDIAYSAYGLKVNPDKEFSFDDYPRAKKEMQKIVSNLVSKMHAVVQNASRKQWLYASKKNDEFLSSIIDTTKLTKSRLEKMQDRNLDALKQFQQRKVDGMNLSQRIWKYAEQFKDQIELGIDVGIGDGRSAQELSRDIRQSLKDPDRLFRRVRDKRGNLALSKHAKAFNPGRGVYRSSYKNAMRLTRSEVNMAYREADWLRWQQLDFVVGFEIKTSNRHEQWLKEVWNKSNKGKVEICDQLKGRYPKTFKFKGWHPQCMCYCVPVLMDEEDFDAQELSDLRSAIKGSPYKRHSARNEVSEMPDNFKKWVEDNTESQKKWKSAPYFVRDNFVDGDLSKGLVYAKAVGGDSAITSTIDYSEINPYIESYASGDMMWVNKYLRDKEAFGYISEEERSYIKELTKLTNAEHVKDDILYRSVDASAIFKNISRSDYDDLVEHLVYGDNSQRKIDKVASLRRVIGQEQTEKGFMSTTRSVDIANEWGGFSGSDKPIVMRIKTNKNTRGFDIERYEKIHHPDIERESPQREVLLSRNQRYKVMSISGGDGSIYVDVELVGDAIESSTTSIISRARLRQERRSQASIDDIKRR